MPQGLRTKLALINHEHLRPPCHQCGNNVYIAPYARTSSGFVLCSRTCWENYMGGKGEQMDETPRRLE